MNHIIVEMPITQQTEKWALTNYPHLAVQDHSAKRNKYLLLSRSLLQYILQSFYKIQELPSIGYLEHGKPYFIDHPNLAFNITHTNNTMAIIVAKEGPVGIDIEEIKQRKNFVGLEEKVLHSIEKEWLHSQTNYLYGFFTLWSAKEAYLKATGQGLTGLATLELNLEQNVALGTLNSGYLYIQQNINNKSFACYLPSKALINLYEFDGVNLINQSATKNWMEINCINP